jgi:hypothetical protein
MNALPDAADVLRVGDPAHPSLVELVRRYGAELLQQALTPCCRAHTGARSEAGLRGRVVRARGPPWHSVLHELSHYRVHDAGAAREPDRDAGGDDAEECAVCYLQIVLASAGAARARTHAARHGQLGLHVPIRIRASVVRKRCCRRGCGSRTAQSLTETSGPPAVCDREGPGRGWRRQPAIQEEPSRKSSLRLIIQPFGGPALSRRRPR